MFQSITDFLMFVKIRFWLVIEFHDIINEVNYSNNKTMADYTK